MVEADVAAVSTSMAVMPTRSWGCQTTRYSGALLEVANDGDPNPFGTVMDGSGVTCFRAAASAALAVASDVQFKTSETRPVLPAASS